MFLRSGKMIASATVKNTLILLNIKFDNLLNVVEHELQVNKTQEEETVNETNEIVGYVTSSTSTSTNTSDTEPEPLMFNTSNDSEDEYIMDKFNETPDIDFTKQNSWSFLTIKEKIFLGQIKIISEIIEKLNKKHSGKFSKIMMLIPLINEFYDCIFDNYTYIHGNHRFKNLTKLINSKSKEHLKDITTCENYIKTIPQNERYVSVVGKELIDEVKQNISKWHIRYIE